MVELSDDEFAGYEADPSTIPDHDTAIAMLDELDVEIAKIQVQLDAYQIQVLEGRATVKSQQWMVAATYAQNMKKALRIRVSRRDRELRHISLAQPKKDPAIGLAKQERLRTEAQARRDTTQARHIEAQNVARQLAATKDFAQRFVKVAQARLPAETYQTLYDATNGGEHVSEPLRIHQREI